MKAKVMLTTGSWYKVLCEDGHMRDVRLKGRFKTEGIKMTNPVAVGDNVILVNADDEHGVVIDQIQPRSNYIVRQSPRKKFHQHILAANIDQALLVATISRPRTSLGFVDRFIVAAESFHIPVRIIINKTDLLQDTQRAELDRWMTLYRGIGYETRAVSAETGEGMEEIRALTTDRVTLLAGHSGVGKSSIINFLAPGMDLRVKEISEKFKKGRHTTTFAAIHHLYGKTYIVDTPGIKEFGLSQIEPAELSGYFAEMKALVNQCRYHNCLHREEPGCIIKEAVQQGTIAESRYVNYLLMLDSLESINHWERF